MWEGLWIKDLWVGLQVKHLWAVGKVYLHAYEASS